MRRRNPGPDGDYEDWEFPDPDEIEELSNLPEPKGPPRIAGFPVSFILKVIAFFIIAGLIGSLVLPVLEPLGGARPAESPIIDTNRDVAEYHAWLNDAVTRGLDDSRNAARAEYLGVQFGESGHDPIIGILAQGYDPTNSYPSAILNAPSIEVLKRVFSDDRAERATLAWLWTPPGTGEDSTPEIALLVTMHRDTAQGIDWSYMRAADLPRLADQYQEAHPPRGSLPIPA